MADEKGWAEYLNADAIATAATPPEFRVLSNNQFAVGAAATLKFYDITATLIATYTFTANLSALTSTMMVVPGSDDVVLPFRATGSGTVTYAGGGSLSYVVDDGVLIRINTTGAVSAVKTSGVSSSASGFVLRDLTAAGKCLCTWIPTSSSLKQNYGLFDISAAGTGSTTFTATYYTAASAPAIASVSGAALTDANVIVVFWSATIGGTPHIRLDVDSNADGTMDVTGNDHPTATIADSAFRKIGHLGNDVYLTWTKFSTQTLYIDKMTSASWSTITNLSTSTLGGSAVNPGWSAGYNFIPGAQLTTRTSGGSIFFAYKATSNHTIDSGLGLTFTLPTGHTGGWVLCEFNTSGALVGARVMYAHNYSGSLPSDIGVSFTSAADGIVRPIVLFASISIQYDLTSQKTRSYTNAATNRWTIWYNPVRGGWSVGRIAF